MSIYRADLHAHSNASIDGRSSLADLAAAAARAGLDALAVTDHDLCTPVPQRLNGVLLIPGCEISTQAGHITGLFLDRPVDPAVLGHVPPPEAAVAAIRAAGGLAVLAHPYQLPENQQAAYPFDLDGIETANARASLRVPQANELAAALAQRRGLPAAGGSDAHHAPEVGRAYTELEADELTLPALRAALAADRSRAVLVRGSSYLSKGLSQWTKVRRLGGVSNLSRGVVYLTWCLGQEALHLGKSYIPQPHDGPAGPQH